MKRAGKEKTAGNIGLARLLVYASEAAIASF